MNSNCPRLALDFALVGGTTNGKADTIHVNSVSPCLPLLALALDFALRGGVALMG